ncbi:biopolymer transporter ExbD [bacterium]|nr:biopolymer transporter ExbD [bacterium]
MKFPAKKKKSAEIPTASMSDIAFLLIVFFMAVGKFDNKQGIPYQIAAPAQEEQQEEEDVILDRQNLIEIEIWNEAGTQNVIYEYFVYGENDIKQDGVKFRVQDLGKQMIKDKVDKNPDSVILLKIDRNVEYSGFIAIFDALRANNMAKKVKFERHYLNK